MKEMEMNWGSITSREIMIIITFIYCNWVVTWRQMLFNSPQWHFCSPIYMLHVPWLWVKHEVYTLDTKGHKHLVQYCIWLQALFLHELTELKIRSSTGPTDNFHTDRLVTGQKEQRSIKPQNMIYELNTHFPLLQHRFNFRHCLIIPFQFGIDNLMEKMTIC